MFFPEKLCKHILNCFFQLCRRASLEDLEQVSCQLAPTVQHRIIAAQSEQHIDQLIRKRETTDNTTIIAEVDENNT